MQNIDLKNFAFNSQKIPSSLLLSEATERKISTKKILATHFFDFMMCTMATSTLASVYNISIKSLLVTKGLRLAFADQDTNFLAMLLLPASVFSYYFLCYFLNHGQTWGMHLFKSRINLESKNFMQTFNWAFESFLLCFTGGLSFFTDRAKWFNFQVHDHLYHNLMAPKDEYAINLLSNVKSNQNMNDQEIWNQAA